MLSFEMWHLTSLNFYLVLNFVNALKRYQVSRGFVTFLSPLQMKFVKLIHLFDWMDLFMGIIIVTIAAWGKLVTSNNALLMSQEVCIVINVCLSHWDDPEVLKTRPLSLTEASIVFSPTFFSLTCQEEKHIMRCCCPRGYELSMWQGRVWVCLSVPCSFEECPQSTQSSGTASKPESKYHLSRAVILRGHV